jgi:hypothetical protein
MLPKNLSSKYSQYKNDTDSIASWLATTARECGYVSLSKSKGPKNKGKTPPVRQTYTIPIKDFTTLAEFVATRTEPPVDVPPKFASLLDRAIAARQWYSGAISPYLPDDDKKLESDDKHAFFLSVLQKVRDILKFRYPKNHVNSKKAPKDMAEVLNMFENLELQEPSEMFEKAPDVAPSAPKAPKVTYKAERVDGLKEDFLAFYFLMSDLNALRTEVSKSWQAYQQGLMDIVVASLITNTAVDLARAMVEDLSQQFAKHGGIEKMLEAFYAAQCEEAGTKESFKERPGDDLNFRMYDIAGVAFWPAYILLNAFCKVIEEVRIPEMKPGFYGIYDPSTDWFKKNAREKFKDDKILLLELLPEFMFLARITERTPAEDEFTRGLRTMFKTKKVTLCLAYAATIFLDIHHILRGETDYCFQALSETMSVVLSNIENIQKFHKDLTIENWPQQNDEIMAAFVSEIKYYVHTDRYQIEAKRLKRINIPKPYYFLRNHPWSCGLLKYYIQTNFRDLSITFVNAWGSVMSCQHLYNAARNDKLLTKSWPDMDLCFAIQGPEPFFVGSPPTSPDDYLKRFILAMGGSATNFVAKNNRKKKGVKVSKRGPQSLKELAPVLSTFRARYCAETMRFELKTEDVERILEKSEWQYEASFTSPNNALKTLSLMRFYIFRWTKTIC